MAFVEESIEVGGARVHQRRAGSGPSLLLLNSGMWVEPRLEVIDRLAQNFAVIAPDHPGFGASERSDHLDTVDDLSYFYLDYLDQLGLDDVLLVGASFGGWIAAEIAVRNTRRIARIALANPLGIKVGDREQREIADIFAMTDEERNKAIFADPELGRREYASLSKEEALLAAASRESLARYGWSPYMHNPKLLGRLHRIDVPTLILRGEADGLTAQSYHEAFCAALPDARLEIIAGAGHLPHIERADDFASRLTDFAAAQPVLANTESY